MVRYVQIRLRIVTRYKNAACIHLNESMIFWRWWAWMLMEKKCGNFALQKTSTRRIRNPLNSREAHKICKVGKEGDLPQKKVWYASNEIFALLLNFPMLLDNSIHHLFQNWWKFDSFEWSSFCFVLRVLLIFRDSEKLRLSVHHCSGERISFIELAPR